MDVLGSVSEEMGHSPGFGWGLGRGMKAVRACTRASALGNRPHAAGETVKIKGYKGKGSGGEPKKKRRATKIALASSPHVKSGFHEAQAFGRNSHPLSFWLPPHPTFQ